MHIAVLMLGASTWGYAFFTFGTYPDWAPSLADLNATTVDPCAARLAATAGATMATTLV